MTSENAAETMAAIEAVEPGTETTQWERMSTKERMDFLSSAIQNAKIIKFTRKDDVENGRRVFGPKYPLRWYFGVITELTYRDVPGLSEPTLRAGMVIALQQASNASPYTPPPNSYPGAQGAQLQFAATVYWDDLYDVILI